MGPLKWCRAFLNAVLPIRVTMSIASLLLGELAIENDLAFPSASVIDGFMRVTLTNCPALKEKLEWEVSNQKAIVCSATSFLSFNGKINLIKRKTELRLVEEFLFYWQQFLFSFFSFLCIRSSKRTFLVIIPRHQRK